MQTPTEKSSETMILTGGLGPLKERLEFQIKPLTVFIGPQGTGKSLISQLLYFFRDSEYLLANYFSQEGPDATVRKVVEGIRSGELTNRALASFLTTSKSHLQYHSEKMREIALYQSNRNIRPLDAFRREVEKWLKQVMEDPSVPGRMFAKALFVPAERTFYSRFINASPALLGDRALPITMREFSKTLNRAADTHQHWQRDKNSIPTEAHQIQSQIGNELAGRAIIATRGPYARQWQWLPAESQQPLEIEMASSGQMGAWPLVSTVQALFGWPATERPQFIHVEEPETHLHPAGQVAIANLFVFLVNKGFKLVITTHSLEFLYALNNAILAFQQFGLTPSPNGFPPAPDFRLNPQQVIAYLFANHTARPILTESGQIDEGLLGATLGKLEIEFSQLLAHNISWK